MSLREFNRYWKAIPRTWENILMANHPQLKPRHVIPTTYFNHNLKGHLQPDHHIVPGPKRCTCVLWRRDHRINFTMRISHAQKLSEYAYLKNTVYQLDILNDEFEQETFYVLCSNLRSQMVSNEVQHMEFKEFFPNQENVVSIPIKYTGVEEEIPRPKKFEKAIVRYKEHRKDFDLYWYGGGEIPAYISVDVTRLAPPDNSSVCLSDVKLHPLLRPTNLLDLDQQKILEIHLELPKDLKDELAEMEEAAEAAAKTTAIAAKTTAKN